MDYVEVSDLMEQQIQEQIEDPTKIWSFEKIVGHQGPLENGHKDYKGSKYNFQLKW